MVCAGSQRRHIARFGIVHFVTPFRYKFLYHVRRLSAEIFQHDGKIIAHGYYSVFVSFRVNAKVCPPPELFDDLI